MPKEGALKMKNQISINWHVEDVMDRDEEMCDENDSLLTLAQAQEVLRMMDKNHDANIGINWDVIDIWINEIKNKI